MPTVSMHEFETDLKLNKEKSPFYKFVQEKRIDDFRRDLESRNQVIKKLKEQNDNDSYDGQNKNQCNSIVVSPPGEITIVDMDGCSNRDDNLEKRQNDKYMYSDFQLTEG